MLVLNTCDGVGHLADLVLAADAGDLDRLVAARERPHRHAHAHHRARDAAADQPGEHRAEQQSADRQIEDQRTRPRHRGQRVVLFLLFLGDAAGLDRLGVGLDLLADGRHRLVDHVVDGRLEVGCLAIGVPIRWPLRSAFHRKSCGTQRPWWRHPAPAARREIRERFLRRGLRRLLVVQQEFVGIEPREHQVLQALIAEHRDIAVARLGGGGDQRLEMLQKTGAQWDRACR